MVFDPIGDIEFFDDGPTAVAYADERVKELRNGPQPEAAEAVTVSLVFQRYDEDDDEIEIATMH